ncbi:MAG: hypothetical protein GY749_01130 [Desulfobacteraceae bacterium]|nr:hypothetical protein [Desulfobacteraceae bacterium]
MLKKATHLSEILSAFPQAPLQEDEFDEFYIYADKERDSSLSRVDELKEKLLKDNNKILFAGHRGSGKSTEINRLTRDITSKYFIVKFSVTQELDVIDLNYIDLVMIMMEQIAEQSEAAGLIEKNSKHLEKIKNWLADITQTKAEDTGYMIEVGAGLKTDKGALSLFIGLIAEFKAAVKSSTSYKKEFRRKIEERVNILKGYCNVLINEIIPKLKAQGKQLLVIIEDIDKAEIAKTHEIFFGHSGVLSDLNTGIIFTVSSFALTTPNLADLRGRYEIVRLPMLKVKEKNGNDYNKGINIVREIVKKRSELSLFDENVLGTMIERSGGVLRDLFEMIVIAASSAKFRNLDIIDRKASDYAFERLKTDYRGMITVWGNTGITTDDLYNRLMEVNESVTKEFSLDPIFTT